MSSTNGTIVPLDGLRGLGALLVVIAHVNLAWLPGVHIWMDMFFVLSAYFITLGLVRSRARLGYLPLFTFYKRRLLRLYPALVVVVTVYMLVILVLLPAPHTAQYLDALSTLLYFSNFTKLYDYHLPHYFGQTWSLAVEEHFYLLWPLFMIITVKLAGIRRQYWLWILVLVFLEVWRVYLYQSDVPWSRLYYATDLRLDAFVLGGLLAVMQPHLASLKSSNWLYRLCNLAGLLFLLSVFWIRPQEREYFLWQQPLVLLAVMGLITVLAHNSESWLKDVFSWRPLVWCGVRCYGIYLIHWPMLWLLKSQTNLSAWQMLLCVIPLTLWLAGLMYRYVERPILESRPQPALHQKTVVSSLN